MCVWTALASVGRYRGRYIGEGDITASCTHSWHLESAPLRMHRATPHPTLFLDLLGRISSSVQTRDLCDMMSELLTLNREYTPNDLAHKFKATREDAKTILVRDEHSA